MTIRLSGEDNELEWESGKDGCPIQIECRRDDGCRQPRGDERMPRILPVCEYMSVFLTLSLSLSLSLYVLCVRPKVCLCRESVLNTKHREREETKGRAREEERIEWERRHQTVSSWSGKGGSARWMSHLSKWWYLQPGRPTAMLRILDGATGMDSIGQQRWHAMRWYSPHTHITLAQCVLCSSCSCQILLRRMMMHTTREMFATNKLNNVTCQQSSN